MTPKVALVGVTISIFRDILLLTSAVGGRRCRGPRCSRMNKDAARKTIFCDETPP